MRRRATPQDPNAPLPGQTPMFADEPTPIPPAAPRPPRADGFVPAKTLEFVQCPSCGLKQSQGMLERGGGLCAGCDKPVGAPTAAGPDVPAPGPRRRRAAPVGDPLPPAVEKAISSIAADYPRARPVDDEQTDATGQRAREIAAEVARVQANDARVQANDAREAAENPPECCDACGALLTETALGLFYPCGHDPRGKQDAAESPKPKTIDELRANQPNAEVQVDVATGVSLSPGTVTVTWGEEKFSPVQFNSFAVGPFSITEAVRAGETYERCFARLHAKLAAFAEAVIAAKKAAFMKALRGLDNK